MRAASAAFCLTILLATLPAGSALAEIQGPTIEHRAAVLQGLDKVTARTSTFQVSIGETVRFGALVITVQSCDRTPPTEPPESAVFLDIYEAREGETRTDLFHGWMFASSPALNALEHPVYDVWALECLSDLPASVGPGFPTPRPKPIAPE